MMANRIVMTVIFLYFFNSGENAEWEQPQGSKDILVPPLCGESHPQVVGYHICRQKTVIVIDTRIGVREIVLSGRRESEVYGEEGSPLHNALLWWREFRFSMLSSFCADL